MVSADDSSTQQSLVLELRGFGGEVLDFEDELSEAIEPVGGEVDGTAHGASSVSWFCYGPSAEEMFAAFEPLILRWPPGRGSRAILSDPAGFAERVERTTISIAAGTRRRRKTEIIEVPPPRCVLGDWYTVEMPEEQIVGWAVGRVVARCEDQLISYVFGELFETPPELKSVRHLRLGDAITAVITSDSWLREKRADVGVLGGSEEFEDAEWPVPDFAHTPNSPRPSIVSFDRRMNDTYRRVEHLELEGLPENRLTLGAPAWRIVHAMGTPSPDDPPGLPRHRYVDEHPPGTR